MQVEHNVCIRPFIDNKILSRYRINDNVAIDIGTDKVYPYGEPPRDVWFARVYLVSPYIERAMQHSPTKQYEFNAMFSAHVADTRHEVAAAACGVLIALGMQFEAGDAWNVKALEFLAYDDAIEAN